jgi:nitrite reductase/ring-hydroxylating ferredoxin subunit
VSARARGRPARDPAIHRALLLCYPAAWRERYGDEFLALLADGRSGPRSLLDALAGALDARLRYRPSAGGLQPSAPSGEVIMPVRSMPAHGIVAGGPPAGVMGRRGFMRRMLGAGVGLLSLEFVAGSLNFTWPQTRAGIGGVFRIGTLAQIVDAQPGFAAGWPYAFNPASLFLVNVPAAIALAEGREVSVPDPAADQLLALWRKCPHLGCIVPAPCDAVTRYQCRCHKSTYNILGEKMKEGPAERGLDRFAVSIDGDGVVVVDTSVITQGAPNRGEDALVFHDPHPWDATCGLG